MANIPGLVANVSPGVYSQTQTVGNGVSVPINNARVSCIIGLGARNEVIVTTANGDGYDGTNINFTGSSTGSTGRFFQLSLFPIISNRTQLFRNGVLLQGLEEQIDSSTFPDIYDYRVDIATGHIELQTAHLVDLGGSFYTIGPSNVGIGTIQNLTLVDKNAPNENWTIKCITVQRDGSNNPIAGTAKFSAFGSVSGQILDANGNPILWVADNQVTTNGILSFSILETTSGPSVISPFREGDLFSLQVSSGVLSKNDSLTAVYIPVADINDPTFFTDMQSLTAKHGPVSLSNTLSLGSFLAFANSTPGILAMEAAPPLPRRTSLELESNFPATSTNDEDFILPFPLGVSPDDNSDIHFFVTSPVTGVEAQILPNKFPYFTSDIGQPTVHEFIVDNANPPSGNSYSYSVIQENASLNFGFDGYINRDLSTQINAVFSSASITFTTDYIGKTVNIIDAVNLANIGSFPVVSVANGKLAIRAEDTPPFADFVNDTSVSFHLVDPVTGLTVPSSTGTDGTLVAIGSSATGTFHSTAINFGALNALGHGYKVQITASTTGTNLGLFDITAYDSGTNTLTIAKSFVSEHNLKFEVIDSSQKSDFLVLNHNIVPNGYSLRITYIDSRDATFFDAGWETALITLEATELDILVPLPNQTISVIFENCLNHCLTMSNIFNRKERVLMIGAINGLTPDNVTGAKLAAVEDIGILEGIQGNTTAEILAGNTEDLANYSVSNAYGETYRAIYFYPDQIVAQVGTSNQIIDGFYLAAAAAGKLSGTSNVSVPLTNKIISGFTILKNRVFSPTVIQNLINAGITVLQPVAGGGRVVWGITTAQSGFPEEQEISIVFIRDRISKQFRLGFQAFIGNPEDPDTTGTLTARAISMLNSFVSQNLITQFANLVVARDNVDPRQWNVSVQVQPVYPVNWVYINVSVGRITGT